MKKTLFTALLCLAVIVESQAQVSFKPGVRAGANFSKLTQLESSFKTDFYVGAYAGLQIGRFYTLQPELTYSNQGGADMELMNYNDGTLERGQIDISYVSLAVINKLHFSDRVNFHLGPMFDIQTGRNPYTNAEVDIAFTAGLGFTIVDGLAIEGRIKKGIVDVVDSYYSYSNSPYVGNYNTNFLFQLGLSYTFALKNPNTD